jgi:hypothetical protein
MFRSKIENLNFQNLHFVFAGWAVGLAASLAAGLGAAGRLVAI